MNVEQEQMSMAPEFVSDGCSLFPEGNWGHCCIQHDWAYHTGVDTFVADVALFKCVADVNVPVAIVMFVGLSFFGGAYAYFKHGAKKKVSDIIKKNEDS